MIGNQLRSTACLALGALWILGGGVGCDEDPQAKSISASMGSKLASAAPIGGGAVVDAEPDASPPDAPTADPGGPEVGPETSTPDAVEPDAPEPDAPEPDVEPPLLDEDGDGVEDASDNCPALANADQWDSDGDGVGDVCATANGTPEHPFIIPGCHPVPDYVDARSTCDATSDAFDTYPPSDTDESGPEYVYIVHLEQLTFLRAFIAYPEPADTDVDVHLLSSLAPLELIERDHYELSALLDPGTYYLVLDTFVSGGSAQCGDYDLTVQLTPVQAGTLDDPITPGGAVTTPLALPFWYQDARDTSASASDVFDSYPPNTVDESGPEVIYSFTIGSPARLAAVLETPEPNGTDVDVHLLSSLDPVELVERGNRAVYAIVEPGTYHIVIDTYTDLAGPYKFSLSVRERGVSDGTHFNDYILASVDYIYANYGLLGYDSAVLTHDVPYDDDLIEMWGGAKTMCVAAVMEVILEALNIYVADTGDPSAHEHLPASSWKTLNSQNIKAHIWVNYDLDAGGTADALRHFGMGDNLPFEELTPGTFINLNRTSGTGHAVVFISFIDIMANEYATWNEGVIGFKYFSSQGGFDEGAGGMDYRYAIFDDHGTPPMPYKRDLHVIYSTNQTYLNSGEMYLPALWIAPPYLANGYVVPVETRFDPTYFTGETADDDLD